LISHSLGGAQALLAGMDLYQREKRLTATNLSIYTVGCPRVGNPAFAYYVDSTGIPFSRSVNNRDIVPHVPPQAFGFLHPGVEAWDRSSSSVRKYILRIIFCKLKYEY
jgi:predicted lipase